MASALSTARPLQGLLNGGGARAIEGARLYVLQGNMTGQGGASTSLLTSATGNPTDSIGYYVLTNRQGGFSIAGDYRCVAGRPVYLYARGGSSGKARVNPAIGLMAFMGTCPEAGNFDTAVPFVFMNAATTVAAAYVMANDAPDPIHFAPASPYKLATLANLVHLGTGRANGSAPANSLAGAPQGKINTLANILSACINSAGSDSKPCKVLFTNAPGRPGSEAVPSETAAAAINIARSPHANVGALYALQSASDAPFQPALVSAPDAFTLPPVESERNDLPASGPQSQARQATVTPL